MGTTLTGKIVAETYDSLLKVTDNNTITGTKKRITDGFGNDTPLLLSSTDVQIDGNLLLPGTTAQYVRGDGSFATFTDVGLTSVGITLGSTGTDANVSGSPLTANGAITLNLPTASATNRGLLSSTDWSTFNNKVGTTRTISTTAPLAGGGSLAANRTLSITQSTTTTDGYLSATDWNTFNNKVSTSRTLTINGTTFDLSANRSWTIADTGLTSVGISMPTAFSVTGSPLTANGTIAITGAGIASQYIDGTGALQTFPTFLSADKLITEVYNSSGATLTKGTIVYINGTQGNLPTIAKALATGDSTSAQTFGFVQTDITNMNNGYVIVAGKLTDLDTSAYTGGTQLYLSPTTAGTYTSTKPYAPNHLVYVGIVVRAHPTQGSIEVKIQNGYELDELHDVSAQSPSNNDGIFFNTSTSLWEKKSVATALGYTPLSGSGTTNTLPKFTGASALGNSNITDTGSLITLGSNTNSSGALGFGTSVLSAYIIRIVSNSTGGTTAFGISNAPTIQSDVTSSSRLFRTSPSTVASSFTLSTLYHFTAEQVTIGAGSSITTQIGFLADSGLVGATNNYGFRGQIPASLTNYNLFMSGTAANFLAGDVGIGVTSNYVSSGPILTTTLTNGGSGYVDGTYTDIAGTVSTGSGTSSLFTVVVSGGIVTSATLTWGGANFRVGDTLTISNTLLGGTGSGLVITVATVDSSQLKVSNINGGDITLNRVDTTTVTNDNIGSIKFEHNDGSTKASGIQAKISASAVSAAGYGSYLSFFTKAAATGASLVEAMRIDSNGGIGIGATFLTAHNLRVDKNITGGSVSHGIYNGGIVQSDVTTQARYYTSAASTQATTFTCSDLRHYLATQGTFGAGSTVSSQAAFFVDSTLIGATNNFGFRGQIASGTGRWNIYMDGTANNHMAGSLGIGTTSLTGYSLNIQQNTTGATTGYGTLVTNTIQSDVTSSYRGYSTNILTQAASFTLSNLIHFRADQSTFGAGSAVTTQTGFNVSASLVGATNNYGFRGSIPSGTNRFNLYMDGTAANYLNGTTLIGSTTDNSTGAKLQVNGGITYVNIFNRQTASYTLVLTDQNDIVEMNVASANNLTIPLNSSVAFPIGTEIQVLQYGAGQTTIVATSGVTTRSKSGQLKIANQYTGVTLVKVGTDEWYVIGNLSA